jgi:hypothetical protein
MELKILQRTFGMEIEMCNVDRTRVSLPAGYSWSEDEQIFNTDGQLSKQFGGEVNTPPLSLLCLEDRENVRSIYQQFKEYGGKLKWSIDTHVHIFAGDLELEELKRIFYFTYYLTPYINQHDNWGDWNDKVFNCQPAITESYYERVKKCETMQELQNTLSNQSRKGYIRFLINIAAIFKTKTVEFRCFNATQSAELAFNCVLSAYRMFDYAVTHTEEDFKAIKSYDEFMEVTKLPEQMPALITPMLYMGNPYHPKECFMAKAIDSNQKMVKAIVDLNLDEICCVNPNMFGFESALYQKIPKLVIYNQNNYCHLLYLLSTGQMTVTFKKDLAWMEEYNDNTPLRLVSLLLIVTKLRKVIEGGNEYKDEELGAYREKFNESIANMREQAQFYIDMLSNCRYVRGTIHDAIKNGEKNILFQLVGDKTSKRTFGIFRRNCEIEDWDVKPTEYYELVESLPKDVNFYVFSETPYLSNLHKLALFDTGHGGKDFGKYLYSNHPKPETKAIIVNDQAVTFAAYNIPPDDLHINDPSLLEIRRCAIDFRILQEHFVYKVNSFQSPRISFVVMYGEYLLGGFGFTKSPANEYDMEQLCDFATNNNVPRLARLVLMCLLSKEVKKVLSRFNRMDTENVFTIAYTKKPVSMKYRGLYDKVKERCTSNSLFYVGELGKFDSKEEIIKTYLKSVKDASKG